MSSPIEKLYLNGNDPSSTEIPEDSSFLKALYITNLEKIIPLVTELLPKLSNLIVLSINRSIMTADIASIIANFVAKSHLLKLELLGSAKRNDPLISIINSIEQSSLRTLNFSALSFPNETTIIIATALENHLLSLTKLSFTKCDFNRDANNDCNGLILMMNVIKRSKLETLILCDVIFFDGEKTMDKDNRAAMAIADCIANSALIKLSLRSTPFTKNEQHVIFDAIMHSSLKTLDVRGCSTLCDFNAINYLILKQNLTKFKFRFSKLNCTIEERYARLDALLDAIQENHSLQNIFLDSDDNGEIFPDQFITKMCDLLKNPRFKSFGLDYRSLSDVALQSIIDAIKQSSITSLEFDGQKTKDEHIMMVRDLLENYHFDKLRLNPRCFADKIIEQILPSIQQSSIIKFRIYNYNGRVRNKLQHEIALLLQPRRQRAYNRRNTKSASQYHK